MKKFGSACFIIALLLSTHPEAATYPLPPSSESLIGDIQYMATRNGDDVANVAEKFDLGFNALKSANPHVDTNYLFPVGSTLQLPTKHLLPSEKRQGIVINLPEMRLYYFPKNGKDVITYPIGIGKIGRTIPIKQALVTQKKENPPWIPPKDIREFNLTRGIVLPRIMPPGPDNPLGTYAIYMSIPTYLMHSTIYPESIGRRASFGCIRMYESDIETLYPLISKGTPILIINKPVKLGWQDNELYLEAHRSLKELNDKNDSNLNDVTQSISALTKQHPSLIDWQAVASILKERDGIPHKIGMKV